MELDGDRCQETDKYDLSDFVKTFPTNSTGESAHWIEEETQYGRTWGNIKMYGHVLLNQGGNLLTRNKYQIKGISRHKLFLQKIIATCHGSYITFMYQEGVLFPSINWKMAPYDSTLFWDVYQQLFWQNHIMALYFILFSHMFVQGWKILPLQLVLIQDIVLIVMIFLQIWQKIIKKPDLFWIEVWILVKIRWVVRIDRERRLWTSRVCWQQRNG